MPTILSSQTQAGQHSEKTYLQSLYPISQENNTELYKYDLLRFIDGYNQCPSAFKVY